MTQIASALASLVVFALLALSPAGEARSTVQPPIASDAMGIRRCNPAVHHLILYDYSPATPVYLSTFTGFAISPHHVVTTYLNTARYARYSQQKIFMHNANGILSEVFVQYIDIFSGLALLYSPTEMKPYIGESDLSTHLPFNGETVKVLSPLGDSTNLMPAVYLGNSNDLIHEAYTVRSANLPVGNTASGSLLINHFGKIAGMYRSPMALAASEEIVPGKAFSYLFAKARSLGQQVPPSEGIHQQLLHQIQALQKRIVSVLMIPPQKQTLRVGSWSVTNLATYFSCHTSGEGGATNVTCEPQNPILLDDHTIGLQLRLIFSDISAKNGQDLSQLIASNDTYIRNFFQNQPLTCRQSRIALDFSSDNQVHLCVLKNNMIDGAFDSVFRFASALHDHHSIYGELFLTGFDEAQNKLLAKIFTGLISPGVQ